MAAVVGIAVPFGERYRISGTYLRGVETVRRGAFHRWLSRRPVIPLFINHDAAASPLVTTHDGFQLWTTPYGLRFRARLSPSHPDTERVLAASRRGQLRGASVKWNIDAGSGFETARTATGWVVLHAAIHELSLCIGTQPAYHGTLATLDTPEARQHLRELDAAAAACRPRPVRGRASRPAGCPRPASFWGGFHRPGWTFMAGCCP